MNEFCLGCTDGRVRGTAGRVAMQHLATGGKVVQGSVLGEQF